MKIASGQNLKIGTVIGMVTESEEYKEVLIKTDETDSSNVAIGAVLQDKRPLKDSFVVIRDAIVIESKIIYPKSATDDQKKKILGDLEKRGIVVRKEI